MPHRVFSLDEAAAYLHMPAVEIQRLVKRGEIPVEKKGDRLTFRKKDIDSWASQRILGLSGEPLQEYHRKSSAKAFDFSNDYAIFPDLMRSAFVAPALTSKTRASVLRDMVELADGTGLVCHKDELLATILEREHMCSTAIPGGIALPHPHAHQPYLFDQSFVVLGRTIQPIPFGAPDGMATDLFFMICCPGDDLHLHVLARICAICHHADALQALRAAETAEDLYEALLAAERAAINAL